MNKQRFKHVMPAIICRIKNLLFWFTQVKLVTYIRYGGKIWLYRKAHLKLHKSCQLKIAEKSYLRLGAPWEPLGPNFYTAFFDTHFVAYKNSYIEIGDRVNIQTGCLFRIQTNGRLIIGNHTGINSFGVIYCYDMIKIGNEVLIAPNVCIRDSDGHHFEYPGYKKPKTAPIIIEDHVWIGLGVTILKGVTIGEGAIIAARSVVTKSIPPHCLAGGNPAKVLRENVVWKR